MQLLIGIINNGDIGFGSYAGSNDKFNQPNITVTPDSATTLLLNELHPTLISLQQLIKVSITQNQLDAIILFVYNLGVGILTRPSETYGVSLLDDLNNVNFDRFAQRMLLYNKVNVNGTYTVSQTLADRRTFESNVFQNGLNLIKANPGTSGLIAVLLGFIIIKLFS